jgi:hypothetical protein
LKPQIEGLKEKTYLEWNWNRSELPEEASTKLAAYNMICPSTCIWKRTANDHIFKRWMCPMIGRSPLVHN